MAALWLFVFGRQPHIASCRMNRARRDNPQGSAFGKLSARFCELANPLDNGGACSTGSFRI